MLRVTDRMNVYAAYNEAAGATQELPENISRQVDHAIATASSSGQDYMQPLQGISDVYLFVKRSNPKKAYALSTTDVFNIKATELKAQVNAQRSYNIIEALLKVPQLPQPDTLFH